MTAEAREQVAKYIECMEDLASAQEQRSYIQGYVDCIQILSILGILKNIEL